jgi:hypothetical protein
MSGFKRKEKSRTFVFSRTRKACTGMQVMDRLEEGDRRKGGVFEKKKS